MALIQGRRRSTLQRTMTVKLHGTTTIFCRAIKLICRKGEIDENANASASSCSCGL